MASGAAYQFQKKELANNALQDFDVGEDEQGWKADDYFLADAGMEDRFPITDEQMNVIKRDLGISLEKVEDLWNLFKAFDKDGTGRLDVTETRLMFHQDDVICTEEEIKNMWSEFDVDCSGTLDFKEILKIYSESSIHKGRALDERMKQLGVDVHERMEKARQTTLDRAQSGVPKKWIVKYIRSELKEEDSCEQLPEAAGLLILYIILVLYHMQAWMAITIEKSIEKDIMENARFAFVGSVPFENGRMGHKTLYDANSIADFWSFLNMGLIPLIFRGEHEFSEVRTSVLTACMKHQELLEDWAFRTLNFSGVDSGTNPQEVAGNCSEAKPQILGSDRKGMYLLYNRIIGGIRLRQERAPAAACRSGTTGKTFGHECFRSAYYLEPDLRDGIGMDMSLVDSPGGETVWLRFPSTVSAVKEKLKEMEDKKWFAPATQKIEVFFASYNRIARFFSLTYVNIFINRGGHFWKQVAQTSIREELYADPFEGPLLMAIDLLFLLMLLRIFVIELKDVASHVWQLGPRRGLQLYLKFWNIVDWFSICSGLFLIFQQFDVIQQTLEVKKLMSGYDATGTHRFEGCSLDDFIERLEHLGSSTRELRTGAFIYPFALMLRLFKAFAAQPRLAVVTKTLQASAIDVAHFLVTFMSVFLTYALSGILLFGREMEDWATYARALNTCMRVLLGDFDVDAMRAVGREEAGIWHWTFTIIIIHIMLNMLLSIVMDTYMEVKGQLKDAETIGSQTREIYHRWRAKRRGQRIDIEDVLKVLDESTLDESDLAGADDLIVLESLLKLVPEIKVGQAKQLLLDSQTLMDREVLAKSSLSDAMQKIQDIEMRSKEIHASIRDLFKLSAMQAKRQEIEVQSVSGKRASIVPLKLDTEKSDKLQCDLFEARIEEVHDLLTQTSDSCADLQGRTMKIRDAVLLLAGRVQHVEKLMTGFRKGMGSGAKRIIRTD